MGFFSMLLNELPCIYHFKFQSYSFQNSGSNNFPLVSSIGYFHSWVRVGFIGVGLGLGLLGLGLLWLGLLWLGLGLGLGLELVVGVRVRAARLCGIILTPFSIRRSSSSSTSRCRAASDPLGGRRMPA